MNNFTRSAPTVRDPTRTAKLPDRSPLLALSWFQNLFDARRESCPWRKEYNEERPHSSLGYQTPKEFAAQAGSFYRAELGQEASNAGPLPQIPIAAQTGHGRKMTQNPKTDTNETRGKLGQESGKGDEGDAQEGSHGEQIVAVLRQVEAGARVAEICCKVGISQATYYLWKRQYSGVGVSELRELRQLREENGRLKRLVADLSMDRQILQEIVSKKL